jgi:hypothetical protein
VASYRPRSNSEPAVSWCDRHGGGSGVCAGHRRLAAAAREAPAGQTARQAAVA